MGRFDANDDDFRARLRKSIDPDFDAKVAAQSKWEPRSGDRVAGITKDHGTVYAADTHSGRVWVLFDKRPPGAQPLVPCSRNDLTLIDRFVAGEFVEVAASHDSTGNWFDHMPAQVIRVREEGEIDVRFDATPQAIHRVAALRLRRMQNHE